MGESGGPWGGSSGRTVIVTNMLMRVDEMRIARAISRRREVETLRPKLGSVALRSAIRESTGRM